MTALRCCSTAAPCAGSWLALLTITSRFVQADHSTALCRGDQPCPANTHNIRVSIYVPRLGLGVSHTVHYHNIRVSSILQNIRVCHCRLAPAAAGNNIRVCQSLPLPLSFLSPGRQAGIHQLPTLQMLYCQLLAHSFPLLFLVPNSFSLLASPKAQSFAIHHTHTQVHSTSNTPCTHTHTHILHIDKHTPTHNLHIEKHKTHTANNTTHTQHAHIHLQCNTTHTAMGAQTHNNIQSKTKHTEQQRNQASKRTKHA